MAVSTDAKPSKYVLVPIASINTDHCHRKHIGDLTAIAESIRRHGGFPRGLLQPIGISENNELAFGKRRLLACRDILGWTEIPATIVNVASLVEAEHDENELRLAFSPMERVAVARLLEQELKRRAGRPKREEVIPAERPELRGKESRDIAAQKAGFPSTTIFRRAAFVHDNGIQELKDAVDAGTVKITTAEKIAHLPKADQKNMLSRNGRPLPEKKPHRTTMASAAVDAEGNELPGAARDASKEFKQLSLAALEALSVVRKSLVSFKESTLKSGAWMNIDKMLSQVSGLRKQIKDGAPHMACESCRGHGCPKCNECGFLNKGAFEKWSKHDSQANNQANSRDA